MNGGTGRARRSAPLEAIVWRRQDVRESSRLVTLLTRERGRIVALAKGAHRPHSALLGRVDLLNRVEVELAGRAVPLLGAARLLHEPRALREPRRFLVACHLVEVLDAAWIVSEPDAALYDLTSGAIRLAERAPPASLPVVVAGIELRLLAHQGSLPALDRCSTCDRPAETLWASGRHGGLACARHREGPTRRLSPAALAWLRELAALPGRAWPAREPPPAHAEVVGVLGGWLSIALERRATFRAMALHT